MNKKQIKQLKKEISNSSAYMVGVYDTEHVVKECSYYFEDVIERVNELHQHFKTESFNNILITESIKVMNYQDFKSIASYFF